MKTKNIFFFLIFVCCGTNAFSQTSDWLWATNPIMPSSGTSQGWSVSSDPSGNVFVTGYFDGPSISFGSVLLTNVDPTGMTRDIFIAKYDPNGNVLWAISVGGNSFDECRAICSDQNGNVYLSGFFFSPTITIGTNTLTNSSIFNDDIFIAKFDANGNVLWAKSAGGSGQDVSRSICVDPLGNVLITGDFSGGNCSFGSIVLNNSGGADLFVVKYDSNGNVLWARSAVGNSYDESDGICTDFNGDIFITGSSGSSTIAFGSILLANNNTHCLFLAKFDSNGNIMWARNANGINSSSDGFSVSTDAVGNVFLAGDFMGDLMLGSFSLGNTQGSDVLIAKYDSNGNVLWVIAGVGDQYDMGYAISANPDGSFFVSGIFFSSSISFGSTIITPSSGANYPMFLLHYEGNGNLICSSSLKSGGYFHSGVSIDPFGNAFVIGDFYTNTLQVGSDTLSQSGAGCVFIAKYNCCVLSISIEGEATILNGETTNLIANGGANYIWSTGEIGPAITVSATTTTTFCVDVTDSTGCSGRACFQVNVIDECATDILIANAFSPNGDGENDFLCAHITTPVCINSFLIAVYDRWGEKVFESKDPDFKWDGSYRGKKMFSQVLNYTIVTTTKSGKKNVRTGNISLVL